MTLNVSKVKGTSGMWNGGKPPWMDARSPTVLVSKPNPAVMPNTTKMAVKPAGTFLVNLGKKAMIAMETKVNPTNRPSSPP